MKLCAFYGLRHGFKCPYDLLMDTAQMPRGGPNSLQAAMQAAGAESLRPEDYAALNPTQWRKEGFVRPGHAGHQGPYASPAAARQQCVRWWGNGPRSTPQQDKDRRRDHASGRG